MLIAAISDDVKNETFRISQNSKFTQCHSDRDIIVNQIGRENQKMKRAKEAYLNGIDSVEEYKRNKNSIQEEINRLTVELEKLSVIEISENGVVAKSKIMEYKKRCQQTLLVLQNPDLSEQEKNSALKLLIERAIYNKSTQSVQVFYI